MEHNISPRGCRWPMWQHGDRPNHHYCGNSRMPGSSYCETHFKKALRENETEPREAFVPGRRAA